MHRFQRIPPTETKGRTHTSTVVVTLIEEVKNTNIVLNKKDYVRETTIGSGPGGQHRNRTQSCVTLIHKQTGLKVRIDGRNQFKNEQLALKILTLKISNLINDKKLIEKRKLKKGQAKSANRGHQKRTYNYKSGYVIDHVSNRRVKIKDILKGKINLLH